MIKKVVINFLKEKDLYFPFYRQELVPEVDLGMVPKKKGLKYRNNRRYEMLIR